MTASAAVTRLPAPPPSPLLLALPKDQTKGTIFEGHGNIKLGVHCQSEGIFTQYVLREYLTNRLHNVLTPRSLRVRLEHVTYADSAAGKKPFTKLGIFFEDMDDLAKRMEARELPVPRQLFKYVEQDQLLFMSLFQYKIGNTDYSIIALHNVIMLDDAKGVRYTVPYDFDYSGLVKALYAVPFKGLGLVSVQDRLYRGPIKGRAIPDVLKISAQNEAALSADMMEWLRKNGIPYVDAKYAVLDVTLKEGDVYTPDSDGHPVAPGYKAYARALYDGCYSRPERKH